MSKGIVKRFDYGELKSASRTPQGFLMCPGFATRCGVFPYRCADGTIRRELRHPEDVLDPVSLATLKNAPVTVEHPPDMLSPKNVKEFSVGHSTDRVEVNRNMVDVDLIIEDQSGIDAVERDGLRELSSGYDAELVEEEGEYDGAPYDYRQKNIVYNHIAIVRSGRAGPEVRLRLDSADAIMDEVARPSGAAFATEMSTDSDDDQPKTKKVVILGREVDLPSDVADVVNDWADRFDEMRAKQSMMEEEMANKTRKDQKDVDINQKGVSPQVDVSQMTPDGRKAPGKTPAQPGTITGGKTDDDEDEDEKKDEDMHGATGGATPNSAEGGSKVLADEDMEDEDMEDDEPAAGKGGGAMTSPLDLLRKDAEEKKAAFDEAQKKCDEFAAASMNQPEKKPEGGKMDSADIEKRIRARAKLERQAEKLVPFAISKKFDSMTDKDILHSVIKYRHPKADLEGKSKSALQGRFDSIVESLEEDGTRERQNAGKALLGVGGRTDASDERMDADPDGARNKMISEGRKLWSVPLSVSKK